MQHVTIITKPENKQEDIVHKNSKVVLKIELPFANRLYMVNNSISVDADDMDKKLYIIHLMNALEKIDRGVLIHFYHDEDTLYVGNIDNMLCSGSEFYYPEFKLFIEDKKLTFYEKSLILSINNSQILLERNNIIVVGTTQTVYDTDSLENITLYELIRRNS